MSRNHLFVVTRSILAMAFVGLLGGCGTLVLQDEPEMTETEKMYQVIIQESQDAFLARDVEGAIATLDEDFAYYEVSEEGPKKTIGGKEEVRKVLGMLFQSDAWVSSRVDFWGMKDNIQVQVEYDTFRQEDGSLVEVPTLAVFEHRNGKRWREWRFRPEDR